MSKVTWFSTGYLNAQPTGKIDPVEGFIGGVSITTEGEAKGHGVHLDESFIDAVVAQGNETKTKGLKARFGHPNMCSTALGTFIGRFKNFRKESFTRDDGSKAFKAVADLFLSNSSKETPNGNLFEYVLNMAKSEADMFGTSIVFERGRLYRKTKAGSRAYEVWDRGPDGSLKYDSEGRAILLGYVDDKGNPVKSEDLTEQTFVECQKLHACDAVDQPAANDGLFSQFASESIAGQVTEFLDLNPQVWDAVEKHPGILEALSRHEGRVEEFMNRYRVYREKQKGANMRVIKQDGSEKSTALEGAPSGAAPEASSAPVIEEKKPETAEPVSPTPEPVKPAETAPVNEPGKPAEHAEPQKPASALSVTQDPAKLFSRVKKDFGVEVAAEILEKGGTYEDALKIAYDRTVKENSSLKARLEAKDGGKPAEFGFEPKPKERMFKSVR